jgi:hypothetical protein
MPVECSLKVVLFHTVRGPKSSFIGRTTPCSLNLQPFFTSVDNKLEYSSGN